MFSVVDPSVVLGAEVRVAASREKCVLVAASFSLPEEHHKLRPESVSIVVCSVLM